MKNNYESIQDMQRMQQEAVRRVQEMQRRAKQTLTAKGQYSTEQNLNSQNKEIHTKINTENIEMQPDEIKNEVKEKIIEIQPETIIPQANAAIKLNKAHSSPNFFDSLIQDSEKCLIILLILLLSDEGCDMSLVLSLMYLIM